ncbi:hypothetical protein [Actinomadura sp. 6N118]|uniref:hypothetical protein n=1 Tax=Actinomadura sp. 6N118 TaxID=3375151 RepID=UPI0037926FD6
MGEQMIVLADRNFAAGWLVAAIADSRAQLLVRVRTGRTAPRLPVMRRLGDGSYLSRFGGIEVRVIDAEITIAATRTGRTTGAYRLITTLVRWCGSTTSGGRRPPTWSSSPPC